VKKIIIFLTFLVLIFIGYVDCQAMTNEIIESRKKTVVFIGKLQQKESTIIDKDGKCIVVHKIEPQFIATGFLVFISNSLGFFEDEFNSKLTANNLRQVITADIGNVLPSSPVESLEWLNSLIRMPDLYEKLIARRDVKTLNSEASKQIETFKHYYNESKKEKDLMIQNRIILEAFYPNETPKSKSVYHLVTAKHVICDRELNKILDQELFVFYNLKDGSLKSVPISGIKEKENVDWIFHKNAQVDIALIPFPLDTAKDDIMTIPDKMFLSSDKILETYDVFFLSFQPGTENVERIAPIIRKGMISRINTDGTFYIDGFAFPGNSGSPVFIKPELGWLGDKRYAIGSDPIAGKFIGIIGAYIPYQDYAISIKTKRTRIMFEENTGLSQVWPVDLINEIIESVPFQDQLGKILKKQGTRR
jgi:hypothetical protein